MAPAPNPPAPIPLLKHGHEVNAGEKREREAIRDVAFEEPMARLLARQLGGEQSMKEACAKSRMSTPVEISETVFGDLDCDGYEEAAVTAYPCIAGQGQSGPNLFAVFKRQPSGAIVELALDKAWDTPSFKDKSVLQNLQGPWSIQIDKGRLVMRYLSGADHPPKCGDSECSIDYIYRWDGQKLALLDITKSPKK